MSGSTHFVNVDSRMRDFFDIYALADQCRFSGDILAAAVRATFERRRTLIPEALPLALTPEFAALSTKLSQWRGFLSKSGVNSAPRELVQVIRTNAGFLGSVIDAACTGVPLNMIWPPGGPWQPDGDRK